MPSIRKGHRSQNMEGAGQCSGTDGNFPTKKQKMPERQQKTNKDAKDTREFEAATEGPGQKDTVGPRMLDGGMTVRDMQDTSEASIIRRFISLYLPYKRHEQQERTFAPYPEQYEQQERTSAPNPQQYEQQERTSAPNPQYYEQQERTFAPNSQYYGQEERTSAPNPQYYEQEERTSAPNPQYYEQQERTSAPNPEQYEQQESTFAPNLEQYEQQGELYYPKWKSPSLELDQFSNQELYEDSDGFLWLV